MGITLAKLLSNSKTIDVSYEGDLIQFTYYPARLTEQVIQEMTAVQSATDEQSVMDGFRTFNEALCQLIKSWTIFEDEEETQMFPLDPTRIRELPIKLRMQFFGAIMNDYRPEAVTPQAMKNGA